MSDLDDHFRAARADTPKPSSGLLDAAHLDAILVQARMFAPLPSQVLMARIARDAKAYRQRLAIWPAASLIAACAVGLLVGISDPLGLVADWIGDTEAMALLPDYGFALAEEG